MKPLLKLCLHFLLAAFGLVVGLLLRWSLGSGLQWNQAANLGSAPNVAEPKAESIVVKTKDGWEPKGEAARRLILSQQEDSTTVLQNLTAEIERLWTEAPFGGGHDASQVELLLDRAMRLAPQETLAELARRFTTSTFIRRMALLAWFKQDPSSARNWISTNDPKMAAKLAQAEEAGDNIQNHIISNLSVISKAKLVEKDPVAGEALLKRSGLRRGELIDALLKSRSDQSPSQKLEWVKQLPTTEDREQAFAMLIGDWAKKDPHSAAAAWIGLPNNVAKATALSSLVNSWLVSDPPGAIAWLKTQPQSPNIQKMLANSLSGRSDAEIAESLPLIKDPESLNTLANSRIKELSGERLWTELAKWQISGATDIDEAALAKEIQKDRDGFLQNYQSMPEGALKDGMIISIAWEMVDHDAAHSFAEVKTLHKGPLRDALVKRLADKPQISPAELLPFLSETNELGVQSIILARNLTTDPSATVDRIQSLPAEQQLESVSKILSRNAASRMAESAALLGALPTSLNQPALYHQQAGRWVLQAPEEASKWVNSLPTGPNRDAAIQGMVANLMTREWDPGSAFTWAGTIQDPASRQSTLERSAEIWMNRNPDQAREAILSSSLSEQEKARLLSPQNVNPTVIQP